MPRARGFTLIEMLVTIAAAAILIGLAVPSFLNTIQDAKMTSAANDLLVSMQLARSEAIKRHAPVTICHSADPNAKPPECGGDGWDDGWIIFVDATEANPDPNGSFDNGEELIRNGRGFPKDKITATAADDAAPLADHLTFLGSGLPQGDVPGGRNLLLCDNRQSDAAGRVLNIAQTGRPQVRRADEIANLSMTCQE
jgi:type IV fimbrial biogenesis protein FimT